MLLSISWHERKKTTIVQWSVVHNFSLVIINLHPQGKGQESCVRSNLDYYQAIFSTAFTFDYLLEKSPYLNVDVVIKKKVCFYHPFWNEETQERGNHEPLVSLRRPGSAEQAQFFSVFRSNGGKRKASARASHAREEEWKIKPRKNTCTPMHTKIE